MAEARIAFIFKNHSFKWLEASKMLCSYQQEVWFENPTLILHANWKMDIDCKWAALFKKYSKIGLSDWAFIRPGKAGIGRYIKDSNDHPLYVFYGPSSAQTIFEAELEAVKHLISEMFKCWHNGDQIGILSDSEEVISFLIEN